MAALPMGASASVEDVTAASSSMGTPPATGTVWAGPRAVLFDNGPLVTDPGAGAGGADESTLQNNTLGMNILGFGVQVSANNSMADDFTIPPGEEWQIDTITSFAYQTGAGSPSTISGMYVRIWSGTPGAGGTVAWGDPAGTWTTNLLSTTAWSNAYRVTENSSGNSDRAIMANVATIGTTLTEGTYWVEYIFDGSASFSGPWGPPVTILGQTTTGNGLRTLGGVWEPLVDSGGTETPQGAPFIIEGTIVGGGGGGGGGTGGLANPIPTLSKTGVVVLVLALIGISAVLIRRRM
jgi:hypothetical protein